MPFTYGLSFTKFGLLKGRQLQSLLSKLQNITLEINAEGIEFSDGR